VMIMMTIIQARVALLFIVVFSVFVSSSLRFVLSCLVGLAVWINNAVSR